MALEQILVRTRELAASKSLYSNKLDNPLLNFHEKIKAKDSNRSGIISLEGGISVDAIETFFGTYGIVKQKLSKLPAASISDYKQTLDLYALYIASSHAHSTISKHVENETQYQTLSTIENVDDEYLLINDLASNYLNGTRFCRTGKELAQTTKGYFTKIRNITKRLLSSKQNSNILKELQNSIEINFEENNQSFNALKQKKLNKKRKNKQDEKLTFGDIGGNSEIKKQLKYLIKSFKHPEKKKYGYKPPRGIFFYGYPGTGKTLSAKVLANECGVSFHSIDITDILSKWYGESERNLKEALSKEGIVFIDEYNSLGKTHQERDGTSLKLVNIIAEAMDGYNSNPNTIYIASSNSLKIEKKLKRAGRFDEFVFFKIPDYTDIKEILLIHLKKLQKSAEVPLFNGISIDKVTSALYTKSQEEQKKNSEVAIVGSDIAEIVRRVHQKKWNKFLDSNSFTKMSTEDFYQAIKDYNMKERI